MKCERVFEISTANNRKGERRKKNNQWPFKFLNLKVIGETALFPYDMLQGNISSLFLKMTALLFSD